MTAAEVATFLDDYRISFQDLPSVVLPDKPPL